MNMYVKDAKTLSSTLKEITTGMQTHDQYITSKRGEPLANNRVQACTGNTDAHKKRFVIHLLVCADVAGEWPAASNQWVCCSDAPIMSA